MLGDAIAQAFADLLGTTLAEGGFIAGGVFTVSIFVAFIILSARLQGSAVPAFGGLLIGAIFSRLMGWWSDWPIVFAALLMAVVIVGPFKSGSSA